MFYRNLFKKSTVLLFLKQSQTFFVNIASVEPFGENDIVKITNSQYTPIQASHSQFTGSAPRTPMFSCGKIIDAKSFYCDDLGTLNME